MFFQGLLSGVFFLLGVMPSSRTVALSTQQNFQPSELTAPDKSDLYNKALQIFTKSDRCSNVVQINSQFLALGHGAYLTGVGGSRAKVPSYVELTSVQNPGAKTLLYTSDAVVAIEMIGNSLYVLTYSGLELWDLSTSQKIQTYETYNINRELNYKEHALGMTVYKDKIIIAHGRLGFSVFDTTTKKLIYQSRLVPEQRPFESQAVDVVVAGGKAIFAMDNFTMVRENEKPAFRGFVIVDLSTYKVEKKLEGLDPGARALSLVNDQLYVSYDGPYWKFSLDQVVTSKANSVLTPANLIWKYAVQGRPVGKPAVLGSVLLSCFKKPPAQAGPGALYVDGAVVLDPKTW